MSGGVQSMSIEMSSLLGLGSTMIQTVVLVVYVVHVGSGPCSLSLLVYGFTGEGETLHPWNGRK